MTPETKFSVDTSGFTEDQFRANQKFSIDGPFNDPVVMCDSCQEMVLREELNKIGCCPHCANTRVRNVRVLTEENHKKLKDWADSGKIDPDFLHLFGVVQ